MGNRAFILTSHGLGILDMLTGDSRFLTADDGILGAVRDSYEGGGAIDIAGNRAFVVDSWLNVLMTIDLSSGERVINFI